MSKDDVLIETVRNRINTYYEKLILKQNNTLTNGTKVFIVGAVSKQANRQKIVAVDKKKMSSTDNTIVKKMAAIVISTEDLYKRKVEVKICSNPINKNIKMGEVYRIDTELLAVVKAHTWKEFVDKNS